ncbi:MAG: SDR family oxidoreductase [Chloroflexi bacterium]|nr:SDR family oxidoreductase [Chloroflexota bacterium]
MLMSLVGKVAIVTGSNGGIGRGIAERFAAGGAKLVVHGRDRAKLQATAEALRAQGTEVLAVAADLGYKNEVDRLFDETIRRYGNVDVLVNNAAWAGPTAHFLEMDEDHWDTVLRTNLKSVYLCCHRAARGMAEQKRPGSIVNISSFAAVRSHRQMAAYDASKGGMEALTRAIAIDLAPFDIRVNVVGPGAIHTGVRDDSTEDLRERRAAPIPLGRVGYPEDIGNAVAFLASDEASYITGQCLYVDGGMLAQLRSRNIDKPLPPSVQRLLS